MPRFVMGLRPWLGPKHGGGTGPEWRQSGNGATPDEGGRESVVLQVDGIVPKVSVIIPTYNCARYLPETLESVLNQSFRDLEVIVVDDGSTDNTKEILRPFLPRIRYVYQENSGGPARPRNRGIGLAGGSYVSCLDSDDILLPGKMAKAVSFLEDVPELGMVFTNFVKCDEEGTPYRGTHLDAYPHFMGLKKVRAGDERFILPGKMTFDGLFHENFIGTSGVVVPRRVFSTVGLFDEGVTAGGVEDRDMWFKIAASYDIGYLNVIGHVYRVRKGSVSRRSVRAARDNITVIRRHMSGTASREARRRARRVIARSLYDIGYEFQSSGEMKTAREHYLQSVREGFLLPPLKGILITLLGRRGERFLKARLRGGYGG